MEIAQDEKGQLIVLKDYSQTEILEMKEENYYCPACLEKLMIKAGRLNAPHFAHYPASECQLFSEAESPAHRKGKLFLADYSQKTVGLEVYLASIQQIPDLLLEKLVIEVQYSPLSMQRFIERNTGYWQAGYQVWWLLGGQMRPLSKLTSRQLAFLEYDSQLGLHFWTIDEVAQELILNYQVVCFANGMWHWQKKVFNRKPFDLEAIFFHKSKQATIKPLTFSPMAYAQQSQQQLFKKIYYKDGRILRLQETLYLLGENLYQLPLQYFLFSPWEVIFKEQLILLRYWFYQIASQRLPKTSMWIFWQNKCQHLFPKERFFLLNEKLVFQAVFNDLYQKEWPLCFK